MPADHSPAGEDAPPTFRISVYIDNGVVFDYDVGGAHQAREHSAAIVAGGYRSVREGEEQTLTHYPPHRIVKVKVVGNRPLSTNYVDRVRGS